MTTEYFYPYARAGAALSAEVTGLLPDDLQLVDDRVKLTASESASVTIHVLCEVDPALVAKCLPAGSDPASDVSLGLKTSSVQSRVRRLEYAPAGEMEHEFEVTLQRADHWGLVELQPVLVLARDLAEEPGLASARGTVLAADPPIIIEFDENSPISGKALPIEWRSFELEPGLGPDEIHALKTEGPQPKILLNRDVPNAYTVLMSLGTTGAEARIRNVEFHKIALQVWTALIGQSLLELSRLASSGLSVEEALDELTGWQADVLHDWAPYLFPECSPGDALQQLLQNIDDNDPDVLQMRTGSAIQRRFKSVGSFRGLIQTQSAFAGGSGSD